VGRFNSKVNISLKDIGDICINFLDVITVQIISKTYR